MSFNDKSDTKKLTSKFWFVLGISLLCVFSLSICLFVSYKNFSKTDTLKTDGEVINLTNQSLFTNNGWNDDTLAKLNKATGTYGDNVALGNSNGVTGVVLSLGGYTWQVVYRENGVLTLLMNEGIKVSAQEMQKASVESLTNYLNNEFYPKLLSAISYENFDSIVVPSADLKLGYQLEDMQNISLTTVQGEEIVNNNVASGLKVWLPSAFEIGGYVIGENASVNRVNSFNTDLVNNVRVASGLWNVSSGCRSSNNAIIRSSTEDSSLLCVNKEGLVVKKGQESFELRPAMNLMLPENATLESIISNQPKLAISGAGTEANPYLVSTASDLVQLSKNVLEGDDYAGKFVKLANDIDLSGITMWVPIGLYNNGVDPKPFSGTFDGDGFKILHASSANSGLVGVFGYVNGGVVKNVAITRTNWKAGGTYAGGLISVMENGASLSVCYNNSSVSGKQCVGGLVGAVNLTSSVSCVVEDVYNTGAVAGTQYAAGVLGSASNVNLARCYNIGSVNKACDIVGNVVANVNVENAYYSDTSLQSIGTKTTNINALRDVNTFTGFTFYGDQTPAGVWFKSNIVNDGFPTLKIFVKTVDVKLFSNIAQAGDYYVTIQGSSSRLKTATAALGASATFTVETNSGYRFLGWYVAVMSVNGQPVIDSSEAVIYNTESVFTQALTDYVYLEARFVKTYVVGVTSLFNDFSLSYINNNAVSVTPVAANNEYDKGTTIIIVVSKTIPELEFLGIGYKTSSAATTYTSIGKDVDNAYGYWSSVTETDSDVTYVLVAGNSIAFTTDEFDIQVQFERKLNLSLCVTTDGVDNFPSAVVQFGTNGTTLTASTVANTATFNYNVAGGLILSVDLTNSMLNGAPLYVLDDWTFEYGEQEVTLDDATTNIVIPNYISSAKAANDSIYNIYLTANFSLNTFEISASAVFNGQKETADSSNADLCTGILLELGSGASVTQITQNRTSMVVAQRANLSICFVPNYAYGYNFMSLSVDGTTVTPTVNASGIYYYDYVMQPKNVQVVITINYININVSNTAVLHSNNAYSSLTEGITITPASFANVNYYTNISSLSVSVSTAGNLHMCYGLESVEVSFGGQTYLPLRTFTNIQAQSSYTLFENNTLVNFLYQQTNTSLNTTNNAPTIRIVFKPIRTTLTLIACYKGSTTVVDSQIYSLSLSETNLIDSDYTTNVFNYILGTEISITASSTNVGHRVLGFSSVRSASSNFVGSATNGYKNTATYSFSLTENLTLYVYFELRTFTIAFESNANTMTNGNATLAEQGVSARDSVSGSIALPFDASSLTTSTITMNYGHTLGFMATANATVNAKNLALVNVLVLDVNDNNNVVATYKTLPSEQQIQMLEDENENVLDNIKIVFRYNFKQIVRIKIGSDVTNTDRLVSSTIQFNNADIPGYHTDIRLTADLIEEIKTSPIGYEVTLVADEDGTDYNVLFLMDISYNITYNDVSTSNTQFQINLDGGSPVTFEITKIQFNNNAVNISGYFVFSN